MADQKINLKIGADAEGLVSACMAAIDKIQAKANKLKIPNGGSGGDGGSGGGGGGGRGGGGTSAAEGVSQYQKAHAKVQEQRGNAIAEATSNLLLIKKQETLRNIAQLERDAIKYNQDTTAITQKRIQAERAVNDEKKAGILLNKASQRSYSELFSNIKEGFKSSGLSGVKGAIGGMSGTERIGMAGTIISATLGAVGSAEEYLARRPIEIAGMQGSAISQTTGRQLGEARTGEYTYQSMYGDARQKAQEQAASSRSLGTTADYLKLAAGIVAAGSAMLAPATFGGSLGAGAIGIAGLGIAGSVLNKGIMDPAKYDAYRAQQEAQDFTAMLAAEQDSSPFRKDAIERLKATGGRDLGMERTLGMKDKDFYGTSGKPGWLKGQMDLGFGDAEIVASSSGILGAGGSTQMARQSGSSLQYQRGLGITNSDQLLGQLSGVQSIPETSKKTLIDIFARGFDSSKYAEENRKYIQSVTEQVYKGGSTSEETGKNIADWIKSAIGETPTTRNISAASSAFESYKSNASALSGFGGGFNVASAMKDPILSKLNPAELTEFFGEGMDMDPNNPAVIAKAKELGFSGGEEFAAYGKKFFQKANKGKITQGGQKSGSFGEMGTIRSQNPNMDTAQVEAYQNNMNDTDQPADIMKDRQALRDRQARAYQAKAEDKNTGNAGDFNTQASAKNAQISLETLSQSINKFASDALEAADKLSGGSQAARNKEKWKMEDKDISDQTFPQRHPWLNSILHPSTILHPDQPTTK